MRIRLVAVLVAMTTLLVGAVVPAGASGGGGPARGSLVDRVAMGTGYVQGQVLVRFKPGTRSDLVSRADAAAGATTLKSFWSVPGLRLVALRGTSVRDALARYRSDPNVLYAEPNRVWPLAAADTTTPNDPGFPNQWDWNNTGQFGGSPDADVDAPEAWDLATGNHRVVVGVIDTGIDYTHPDLVNNVWDNVAECDGTPGVDDDGNGYVDDCHGIDTINGDSDPMDDHGHGTHVSGTIGAVGDNGVGVTGMNWNVQVLACKSHDASGNGTSASVLECFQYVQMERQTFHVPIVATNNSWGGCPEACGFDPALHDAIAAQGRAGILTIAAAGNNSSDNDQSPTYPANYYLPNLIAVAASTNTDAMASFSDYGRESVEVAAPGQQIYSTWWPGGTYAYLSGTSMATPHVAGLAGLIASARPSLAWWQIRNLILAGGDPEPAFAGTTVTGRRVNAYGSLTCTSGRTVSGALSPLPNATLGPIAVAALNIDCWRPAGRMAAVVNPGNVRLILRDNGKRADLAAHDGVYSAVWVPVSKGAYTITYSNGQEVSVSVG